MSGVIVIFHAGCKKTNEPHTPPKITSFCNTYQPVNYKDLKKWEKRLVERNQGDFASFKGFIMLFEKDYSHDNLYRTPEWQAMKVKMQQHFQSYELYMVQAKLNNDIYQNLFYYNQVFKTECQKPSKKSSH